MRSPAAYAAAIAPEIDRLFIAGHRHAGAYARSLRQELGLPSFGLMIDLRALLQRPGGVSLDTAAAVNRYTPRASVEAQLDEHVAQGLLDRDGERYTPTDRGSGVLHALEDVMRRGLEDVWGGRDEVPQALVPALGAVDCPTDVIDLVRYPAFAAKRTAQAPADAPAPFRLWTALDALRYMRADAHALAWSEAGLDVPRIRVLTALWSGEAPPDDARPALSQLGSRGWVRRIDGEWELTGPGREAREAIEDRTNALAAPPYERLAPEARETLITALRALPS